MALPPQYSEGFGGGCSGQANAGHIQVHTREDSSNSLEEMFRVVTDPSCSFSSAKPLKDRKLPRSFFDPSPQSVLQPNMSPPVGEFHFRSASGVSSMQRSPLLTATHGAANASVAAESGPDAAGASPGLRLDTAPASVGVVGGGAAASVSHTRAHSSPAKISNQAAAVAAAAAAAAAAVQQHRQEHLGGPGQQAFYQQSRQTNQTDAAMQEAYADSPSTCPPEFEICPLPAGWEMAFNDENKIYFVDHNSKSTSWYDPRIPRQLQSGWGQSPSEVCRLHIDYLGRCNAYRKLSSLTAQKELLRWKLEMATRNEQLMRQEMYNHHSGGGGVTDPTLQCVFSVDHRRQESSDSGLAPETVATPPLLEIDSGACQMDTDASDTSVDGLLSSLKEADLLLAADIDLPSFRNDFQGSIN